MNRLRELRAAADKSQTDIVVATGIAAPNLSRLENDPDADPKISTAKKLARALGCTLDDLFPMDEPAVPARKRA